jgi:hypothetical protein
MTLDGAQALAWTERLIAVATLLQTVELLQLRPAFADGGIWDWDVLKQEAGSFPRPLGSAVGLLLEQRGFTCVLGLRLFTALLALFLPGAAPPLVLLLTTLLICLRWRGSFNGGSDSMTLLVLQALTVARLAEGSSRVAIGALWYIAIQACLSYFIAGVAKLLNPEWRGGRALPGFLALPRYGLSPALSGIAASTPVLALALSWGVMGFECAFPAALMGREAALGLIGLAMLFHAANAWLFGLNRFFFAWLATYPALLFCAGQSFRQ